MKTGLVRPTIVNGGGGGSSGLTDSVHIQQLSLLQSIDERVLILIGMKHYLVKNHDRGHELTHIETSHSLRLQARRMLEAPTLVRTSVCTEGTDPRCGETPEMYLCNYF